MTRPEPGSKLLLVDDFAGAGHTLVDTRRQLEKQGYHVTTLVLFKDGRSRMVPDFFGIDAANARAILPWERHTVTPEFIRDQVATDNGEKTPLRRDSAYCFTCVDLDGVLLPDLAEHLYDQQLEATLLARDRLTPLDAPPP